MSDAAILVLRATGWGAALSLVLALAASPLGSLPRLARVLGWRRRAGIVAALLALAHASVALTVYLTHDRWASLVHVAWLRSGALALALLVPLLVTSFGRVTRALRVVLWKPLHRLAYVAPVLVVHHLVLAPFAPRAWVLALGTAFAALLVARLRPPRRPTAGADAARP